MNLPPAKPAYDRADEQATRKAIADADRDNLKAGITVGFLYFTDAITGETGKLTVESGVPTWTAL